MISLTILNPKSYQISAFFLFLYLNSYLDILFTFNCVYLSWINPKYRDPRSKLPLKLLNSGELNQTRKSRRPNPLWALWALDSPAHKKFRWNPDNSTLNWNLMILILHTHTPYRAIRMNRNRRPGAPLRLRATVVVFYKLFSLGIVYSTI